MTRYRLILIFVFIAFWTWAAIDPAFRYSWFLENIPILVFIPIVLIVGRLIGFSSASYTLIVAFMMLHMVGAHYTYEEVPIGFSLGEMFHSTRNMYDRFVHACFGLLIAYPAYEVFKKGAKVSEYWNYFFTFCFVMMMASAYEVAEWITSVNSNPAATMAYLGTQGDIWDTQIDMYVAGLGCILMLVAIFLMERRNPAQHISRVRKFAVIGSPVSHSLSPKMFKAMFETLGIDAVYEAKEISPGQLKRFMKDMRAGAYDGVSVTVPHKEEAAALVDTRSPEAERIGAINTVVREGKTLAGHNTDWIGIRHALRDIPDLQSKKILIFGAGGAGRACAYALQSLGVKDISIINRTDAKAIEVAERFGLVYTKGLEIPVDMLINATSIGLQNVDIFPVSNEFLSRVEYVFDMVYGRTDLKARAERLGVKTLDGKEMLVGQAAEQLKLFTGKEVTPEVLAGLL